VSAFERVRGNAIDTPTQARERDIPPVTLCRHCGRAIVHCRQDGTSCGHHLCAGWRHANGCHPCRGRALLAEPASVTPLANRHVTGL
jgi:hypothetical protein